MGFPMESREELLKEKIPGLEIKAKDLAGNKWFEKSGYQMDGIPFDLTLYFMDRKLHRLTGEFPADRFASVKKTLLEKYGEPKRSSEKFSLWILPDESAISLYTVYKPSPRAGGSTKGVVYQISKIIREITEKEIKHKGGWKIKESSKEELEEMMRPAP